MFSLRKTNDLIEGNQCFHMQNQCFDEENQCFTLENKYTYLSDRQNKKQISIILMISGVWGSYPKDLGNDLPRASCGRGWEHVGNIQLL